MAMNRSKLAGILAEKAKHPELSNNPMMKPAPLAPPLSTPHGAEPSMPSMPKVPKFPNLARKLGGK